MISARGKIDILVNNAGINVLGGVEKVSLEDWARIFDVNLTGAFHLIRAVLPSMRKQHSGAIINVSSIAAWSTLGGSDAPYAAAKAGMLALTRAVASEAGPDGIRCNAVAPGIVLTKWVEKNMPGVQRQAEHIPMRRLAQPERHRGDDRIPRLRRRFVHHRRSDNRQWRPLHASVNPIEEFNNG